MSFGLALSVKSGTVYCIYRLLLVDLLLCFYSDFYFYTSKISYYASGFTLSQTYPCLHSLIASFTTSHLCTLLLFSSFSFTVFFFHIPSLRSVQRGIEKQPTVKEKGSETERGGETWWKPRSRTGKQIFFSGTTLLRIWSGTEYKLINLPGFTCHDTLSKWGVRYGSMSKI